MCFVDILVKIWISMVGTSKTKICNNIMLSLPLTSGHLHWFGNTHGSDYSFGGQVKESLFY